MSNWMNLKCPACGDEDHIDIAATVRVRVTRDGTDADASGNGDHVYDLASPAGCAACGRSGCVRDFEEPEQILSRQLAEVLRRALTALNTVPRFSVPGLQTTSYGIAAECDLILKRVTDSKPS